MLQAMRNGMDRWFTRTIISALFLFALGGLVLSDAGSFFRGGVSKGAVAEIGNQELSFSEFDRAYRNALARLKMPQLANIPQYREILARDTLKQEIRTRILGYTAFDNGLVISDEIAAKRLRDYLKPLVDQGMLEVSALQYVLEQQNMSENMLVNRIKNELAIELMMTAITAPVRAPWQLVSDIEQYNNESRSADYITIKYDTFSVEAPNDMVLKDFYLQQTDMWMTPEYRTFSVLNITPELVLEKTFGENYITDEKLKLSYQERISEFSEDDKRFVSQVSFAKEENAKTMLKFLAKNPDLSLQQAVDKNKNLNGFFIPSDEYTKTTILPQELTDPVFDLEKETGVVGPIQSLLGWHIAFVGKTLRGNVKSFVEVKDMLKKDIVLDKSADPMFEMVNELEDMFAGGDTVTEAANFLKLPVNVIGPISTESKNQSGKKVTLDVASNTAMHYAFVPKNGNDTQTEVQELDNGSFVAVSVDEVIPATKIDFAKVKKDVLSVWKKQERQKQAKARAHDIISAVRTGESDLKDHTLGKKDKMSQMSLRKRNDTFSGDGKNRVPNSFLSSIFGLEQIKDIGSIPGSGGITVFQLKKIEIGDAPKQKTAEQNNKISEQDVSADLTKSTLELGIREDIIEQFLQARIKKYGVKINEYSFSKRYSAQTTAQD